jgi:hypothetical protein
MAFNFSLNNSLFVSAKPQMFLSNIHLGILAVLPFLDPYAHELHIKLFRFRTESITLNVSSTSNMKSMI